MKQARCIAFGHAHRDGGAAGVDVFGENAFAAREQRARGACVACMGMGRLLE